MFSNIGYNLKPLDLQCAMGLEQLKKLPSFSAKRKAHFQTLYDVLKDYERYLILPRALPKSDPSWFCFPLTVRADAPFTRNDFVMYLESRQIETRMLFSGNILHHPGYKDIKYRIAGDLTQAENTLQNAFFIGVYPGLTEKMMEYMVETIRAFFAGV